MKNKALTKITYAVYSYNVTSKTFCTINYIKGDKNLSKDSVL